MVDGPNELIEVIYVWMAMQMCGEVWDNRSQKRKDLKLRCGKGEFLDVLDGVFIIRSPTGL